MDLFLRELANIDAMSSLRCDYQKTLALLRAMKAGTVSLDNVRMTDDGWTVAAVPPPAPVAEEPAEGPAEESAEEPAEAEVQEVDDG